MTQQSHQHADEPVCEPGLSLYARALRAGRVPTGEAAVAPCTVELGLLYPEDREHPEQPGRTEQSEPPEQPEHPGRTDGARALRPLAPALALPRLLGALEADIARKRRIEATLTNAFQPLMALGAEEATYSRPFTVLHGLKEINHAIEHAVADAREELLTVQPGGHRPPAALSAALPLEQDLLNRGGRMRTLYQHSSRHIPAVLAHYEQLDGDVEVRTLSEVTERLVVLDRRVAFIPANQQRTAALLVRHPALVGYLALMFRRLWDLATPMWPHSGTRTPAAGQSVTARQRAIAALLIEGLTDDKIAIRLAMNVRTVRVHIAKLAGVLGTHSRAQLGYRIGQARILEQDV